ncbi:MAG: GspE/PulE family protein [bacterium]|nr:GspE/PulE family protein [bacterium]
MLTTQLLHHLQSEGRITEGEVAELVAAAKQGEHIERALIDRKLVTEDELLRLRGQLLGLPIMTLVGTVLPVSILETLPRTLAERYHAIAYEREGNRITVGLVDPTDQQSVEALEFYAREQQLSVRYAIISLASFYAALRQYPEQQQATERAISRASEKMTVPAVSAEDAEVDLAAEIERAPVSQIVATVVRHAIEASASDIHIEPHGKQTRIRYRVDGMLQTALTLPISLHTSIIARVKVLAKLKLDETRTPQDGRIHVTEAGREVDLRVSTLPLLDHEKVVMRILETSGGLITLADLGFRPWQIELLSRAVHRPHGMVLLTGPTGSGKSTTLYAVLNLLNEEGVNITTLEDPIEYYVRGVNQAQIRPEVNFTFATGLRAVLRQDPNVIMVGEVRDVETAELAIHAGLTGHLLFSTLHTRDVFGVVPRLTDMKIEPFLLASTLILAEGQRLVRMICQHCKVSVQPSVEIAHAIEQHLATFPSNSIPETVQREGMVLARGKGCPKCGGTGYHGRTVVVELLEFDNQLEQFIVQGFPDKEVRAYIKERGMLTLMQDALLKALEGVTTYEEVLRVSHE